MREYRTSTYAAAIVVLSWISATLNEPKQKRAAVSVVLNSLSHPQLMLLRLTGFCIYQLLGKHSKHLVLLPLHGRALLLPRLWRQPGRRGRGHWSDHDHLVLPQALQRPPGQGRSCIRSYGAPEGARLQVHAMSWQLSSQSCTV